MGTKWYKKNSVYGAHRKSSDFSHIIVELSGVMTEEGSKVVVEV